MAVSKVVYGNNTLIDLTNDTVSADKVLDGYTFHDKAGNAVTGTYRGGGTAFVNADGYINIAIYEDELVGNYYNEDWDYAVDANGDPFNLVDVANGIHTNNIHLSIDVSEIRGGGSGGSNLGRLSIAYNSNWEDGDYFTFNPSDYGYDGFNRVTLDLDGLPNNSGGGGGSYNINDFNIVDGTRAIWVDPEEIINYYDEDDEEYYQYFYRNLYGMIDTEEMEIYNNINVKLDLSDVYNDWKSGGGGGSRLGTHTIELLYPSARNGFTVNANSYALDGFSSVIVNKPYLIDFSSMMKDDDTYDFEYNISQDGIKYINFTWDDYLNSEMYSGDGIGFNSVNLRLNVNVTGNPVRLRSLNLDAGDEGWTSDHTYTYNAEDDGYDGYSEVIISNLPSGGSGGGIDGYELIDLAQYYEPDASDVEYDDGYEANMVYLNYYGLVDNSDNTIANNFTARVNVDALLSGGGGSSSTTVTIGAGQNVKTAITNGLEFSFDTLNLYGVWSGMTSFNQDVALPSGVTSLEHAFDGCTNFNGRVTINSWGTDDLETIAYAFYNCYNFGAYLSWLDDTSSLVNAESAFSGINANEQDFDFDCYITDFNNSFRNSGLDEATIVMPLRSSGVSFRNTFQNTRGNISLRISRADRISSVFNMFRSAKGTMTSIRMTNFPLANVGCNNMFYGCTNMSAFPFNEATFPYYMTGGYQMFAECTKLNVDLELHIGPNVTNLSSMFKNCNAIGGNIYIHNDSLPQTAVNRFLQTKTSRRINVYCNNIGSLMGNTMTTSMGGGYGFNWTETENGYYVGNTYIYNNCPAFDPNDYLG